MKTPFSSVSPSDRISALPGRTKFDRKIGVILGHGLLLAGLVALPTACTHSGSPGPAVVQPAPVSGSSGSLSSPVVPPPVAAASAGAAPAAGSWAAFQETVQPIMELHCYPCHSEVRS
ncbi:MAG: hypothetical protein ABUL68_00215, partial [Pseudomonadota bacterium]